MEPGAYVLCRKIEGAGFLGKLIRPSHQFLALIPASSASLSGLVKNIGGTNALIIGAYNVQGYLRASKFADTDSKCFENYSTIGLSSGVQADKVRVQACLIDGNDDLFLSYLYRLFCYYQVNVGAKNEIVYPEAVKDQLDGARFNSNSWAQSIVTWAGSCVAPGLVTRDFEGTDIGNDRVIPKTYFVP